MIASVNDDKKFLTLTYDTMLEQEQTEISFTKNIRNAAFRTKGKRWKGNVKFIKGLRLLPIGLWHELKGMCDRFGFDLKTKGLSDIIDKNLDREKVFTFCNKLVEHRSDITERPQQIDAVFRALKYRYCMIHASQALGKTAIEYMALMWLFYHKKIKKVLIVCPDMDLVVQAHHEFVEVYSKGRFNLNICMVHGASKIEDITPYNIIIGNFQSLSNREEEFFKGVDCLIIDECHRAGNNSIKYIFDSCINTEYRIGLSGSITTDNSADYFTLLAYLGPIVKHVSKREAIDKGYATEIEIKIFKLNYMSIEDRKKLAMLRYKEEDGEKRFRIEQKIVRASKVRFNWLCELIMRLKGNTLVFFLDVKTGYGKKIVERLRENTITKEIYYIDGSTKKSLRELYKERMEEGDNKILVASNDTYSTGKSIKNLYNIVNAESRKDERVVGQGLGRGMRLHISKDKCLWIDIADDFSIHDGNYDNKNYMLRHLTDRIRLYEKEEFKYEIIEINLMNKMA